MLVINYSSRSDHTRLNVPDGGDHYYTQLNFNIIYLLYRVSEFMYLRKLKYSKTQASAREILQSTYRTFSRNFSRSFPVHFVHRSTCLLLDSTLVNNKSCIWPTGNQAKKGCTFLYVLYKMTLGDFPCYDKCCLKKTYIIFRVRLNNNINNICYNRKAMNKLIKYTFTVKGVTLL